jgi:5'-deoxynucleotidase YfbR-like HD superfamily hydrolase
VVALELDIKVDLRKVIMMLAIHELGETVIGDITPWDENIPEADKRQSEIIAVKEIFVDSGITGGNEIYDLFEEFETNATAEAKFCRQIDKLEACFQVKLYDKQGFAKHTGRNSNPKLQERLQYLIAKGDDTLGKAWVDNEIELGLYSDKILELAKFLKNHEL